MIQTLLPLLEKATASRAPLLDPPHETAFRLFNGFSEGFPSLALDIYGQTLVVHNYADDPEGNRSVIEDAVAYLREKLNWLHAGLVKSRNGQTAREKNGILLFGDRPDRRIREHGVWYTLDLSLNRDTSFYLDTRNLRQWLIGNSRSKTVLNTFAYTGSLGVAAMAGGAERVIQTDRSRSFLNLAKDSYSLNGFPVHKADFLAQDFFPAIARFKSAKQLFDIVLLDPPLFSTTPRGKVDLVNESARLINKVRPLVNQGGMLVSINNALYVSGSEYMKTLEELCKAGYLGIRELIPVPEDFFGSERVGAPVTDPAPFNHPTKIAVLDVRRKS